MYDYHVFVFQWDISKTWFLNISTVSSIYENRWPRIFFLMSWSHWVQSLGNTADGPSIRRQPIRRWFEPMCESSHCHVFRISSKTSRQTNCGVPLRIQRPTMLKLNTWPVLPKKQATSCFKVFFFHKQLSLDLAWVQRPNFASVTLFLAHTHRSMIRHLWRSYKRLSSYFSNISLHQLTRTFFEPLSSCNTECMPKDVSISRYVIWRSIWHYQFTHGINVRWHNGCFWTTFTDLVF